MSSKEHIHTYILAIYFIDSLLWKLYCDDLCLKLSKAAYQNYDKLTLHVFTTVVAPAV